MAFRQENSSLMTKLKNLEGQFQVLKSDKLKSDTEVKNLKNVMKEKDAEILRLKVGFYI